MPPMSWATTLKSPSTAGHTRGAQDFDPSFFFLRVKKTVIDPQWLFIFFVKPRTTAHFVIFATTIVTMQFKPMAIPVR